MRAYLDKFWEHYSKVELWRLVGFTHADNSPWIQVAKCVNVEFDFSVVIPKELIKSYFKQLLKS